MVLEHLEKGGTEKAGKSDCGCWSSLGIRDQCVVRVIPWVLGMLSSY